MRALCREFIDIFDAAVHPLPAKVDAMVIEIDRSKWELPQNRLPQRSHSAMLFWSTMMVVFIDLYRVYHLP